MISIKLAWYRLLFLSETAPSKVTVALASIMWGVIMMITSQFDYVHVFESGFIQVFISISFIIYGIGLLWRIIDGSHRMWSSCTLTLFGAALWVWMSWAMIFAGIIIPEILAANVAIAATACWLFIRAGSGEIISTDTKHLCTIEEREKCKYNIIINNKKE